MEKLGPGDGTSNYLGKASCYISSPLKTVQKDTAVIPNNGLMAQQHNQEFVHRLTGENKSNAFTAVLPEQNNLQHKSQHFCSNKGPPNSSTTVKTVLLQTPTFKLQKAFPALTITNLTQQPHLIVLNTKPSGGLNTLYNQQHHVKLTQNSPKDLVQAQSINLRQQNACVAKDVFQQKYASSKAIAVVTPLTPKECSFSINIPPKSVLNKKDSQHFVSHTFQATTNKKGAKGLDGFTFQTREVTSNFAPATRFSDCVKDNGHKTDNIPPGSSTVPSALLTSESVNSRAVAQPYSINSNSSAKPFTKADSTVINLVDTRMDARMNMLSTIPVQEWSLERLQKVITDLEQTEQKAQKGLPFDDLSSEILKLYWNGDYQIFCNATNLYVDIMKEVRLYCENKNDIILQEVSKERLNKIASNVEILKDGIILPKMVHPSSLLNLGKKHFYIDKEQDNLSSLMTLPCTKTTVAAKEMPVKEMENLKTTNENIKALGEEEEQRNPLPQGHPKNSSGIGDKVVGNGPEDIQVVNNASSEKETGEQDSITVKNIIVDDVSESEKQNTTKCENEAPLHKLSNTQSSYVSDCQIKSGNLFEKLTTDKNVGADSTPVKLSILAPEEAEQPGVNVDNMQKDDVQILPASKGQVSVQFLDQDRKHMDTEKNSDKKTSEIKINCQLEHYCCIAKWFQVLGYKNGGHCKCEKTAELGHHADTSGNNMDKNTVSFNNACKLTGPNVCALQDNKQAINNLRYKSIVGKNSCTLSDDDDDAEDYASMNDLEIVDVVTNYDDVLKMANAMSEQLMEAPLTSGRKPCDRKITKFKTKEKLINLSLFGTSHLRQKKSTSDLTASDKAYLPPETINIRIDSYNPNCTKSQTLKQQVWNSWKKTYVSSKMFTNSKSKKRKIPKPAKTLESKNNPVLKISDGITHWSKTKCKNAYFSTDQQKDTSTNEVKQKRNKKISSTRQHQSKKLKREKKFALLNLKKRLKYAHHGNTLIKSSFDFAPINNTSKKKVNTDLALNFSVLPESFNISEEPIVSTTEAIQFKNTDSGSKVMQTKRRSGVSGSWCESPRKKQCLKPTRTPPNTSRMSAFQEFKKKYEEKKHRFPT